MSLPRLRPHGERRKKKAECGYDCEPDPPHKHRGWGWLAGV
jgi:hypothetical protein